MEGLPRERQAKGKKGFKDGKIDGPYEEYYESGWLKCKCTYKSGRVDGLYEYRRDKRHNGVVRMKGMVNSAGGSSPTQVNGHEYGEWEIEGSVRNFGLSPQEKEAKDKEKGINALKNGEKHGPWEEYDESKGRKSKCTYKDGKLDGPYEEYGSSGRDYGLMKKTTFKNGIEHGKRMERDANWSTYSTYVQGKLHGPYKQILNIGFGDDLFLKGTYNMDEKCGEWIEDGDPVTYDPCPPDLEDGN